jgi:hypothetical protein
MPSMLGLLPVSSDFYVLIRPGESPNPLRLLVSLYSEDITLRTLERAQRMDQPLRRLGRAAGDSWCHIDVDGNTEGLLTIASAIHADWDPCEASTLPTGFDRACTTKT